MSDVDAIKAEAHWRGTVDAKLDAITSRIDTTASSITDLAARKEESHASIYRRIEDGERHHDQVINEVRSEVHVVRGEVSHVRNDMAEMIGKIKVAAAVVGLGAGTGPALAVAISRVLG